MARRFPLLLGLCLAAPLLGSCRRVEEEPAVSIFSAEISASPRTEAGPLTTVTAMLTAADTPLASVALRSAYLRDPATGERMVELRLAMKDPVSLGSHQSRVVTLSNDGLPGAALAPLCGRPAEVILEFGDDAPPGTRHVWIGGPHPVLIQCL